MNLMFAILVRWLLILSAAPLFLGMIPKVKAVIAGKTGPSVLQPYFDLWRLFRKNSVYSRTATWVFQASPVIGLAAVLMLALFVPIGPFQAPLRFSGDMFWAIGILGLARFFMIIAALDTGCSFEGMGASREAFFSCLCEVALMMNMITLGLMTHSISLSAMFAGQAPFAWNACGPILMLVSGSLLIVLLAENSRIPVDDPDTHLELTMVHEVMVLDHSGIDLAFLMYAAAMKLFIFASLLVAILWPLRTGTVWMDAGMFAGCMLAGAITIGMIESSMGRLKLNRVRFLLLIAFALSFLGFVVKIWRG